MADLPSVVEAINDLTSRIERLENSENALEISSIVLRLDYITRMHVNLEVPDEIVNTIRGLYESVVQLEANHNVVEGDGYAAPIFCTGTRGRPSYEIPREQLSFLLDQGFKVSQISGMLGVGQRTVKRRMSAFGLSVSGDIYIFRLLERGFRQESLKEDFNWDVKGNFSWARGGSINSQATTKPCR